MIVAVRIVAVVLAVLAGAAGACAAADEVADKNQQIEELIALHDLATSVSIGNYYLKQDLDSREFPADELDALLTHFHSDVGRKQAKIVDHTVSTHVITTLSFSGKLKDIAGVQEERSRMQHIWNKEDDDMRFSIQDATNAEGQRFAYSAPGRKYFLTAILKLTGIISRRIDELAVALPEEVDARADQVRPLLQEFKSGRG